MRRLLLTLLACLLTLPAAVLVAPAAHACSCERPTPETALPGADLIAEVEVLREAEEDGKRVYGLAVRRAWKGADTSFIEMSTELEGTACGLRLAEGERYVLFGSGSQDEGWSSTWCSGTFAADAPSPPVTRADVEAEYGQGTVPVPPSDAVSTRDLVRDADLVAWLILGGSLLTLLAVGVVLSRMRAGRTR